MFSACRKIAGANCQTLVDPMSRPSVLMTERLSGLTGSTRPGQEAFEPPSMANEQHHLNSRSTSTPRLPPPASTLAAVKECENDEALALCRGRHEGSEAAHVASVAWLARPIAAAEVQVDPRARA